MTLSSVLAGAGIFRPEEINLLYEVFDEMALEGDTDIDRETRAGSLVRLYQSGKRTRESLLLAMGYTASVEEQMSSASDHGVWRRVK
jgi:hypothetical protein